MSDKTDIAYGNTIRAGWLELWSAQALGTKIISRSGGSVLTLSHWRGKLYLIGRRKAERTKRTGGNS